jgi:Na+-transporting NADH:ubiquinone oxidoreductase subunit NqrB
VEDRRRPRIGTVSGLALLTGGTAVAAATGGAHSIFATLLLGMLAVGMAHALIDEIRRQARRRSAAGWARHDTVNALLLAIWSAGALSVAVPAIAPAAVRAVALLLSLGYALSCAYLMIERRRTIAAESAAVRRTGNPHAGTMTTP